MPWDKVYEFDRIGERYNQNFDLTIGLALISICRPGSSGEKKRSQSLSGLNPLPTVRVESYGTCSRIGTMWVTSEVRNTT